MARKFFLVAAGMLMLALSYHFGASAAGAQAPANPLVAIGPMAQGIGIIAYTANGDVYSSGNGVQWGYVSNVFRGAPTPALHESWGQVKARYRSTPGMTVTPGADSR